MTQMYRTLRVALIDEGVLSVVIDAPPMNLIGPLVPFGYQFFNGPFQVGECRAHQACRCDSSGKISRTI